MVHGLLDALRVSFIFVCMLRLEDGTGWWDFGFGDGASILCVRDEGYGDGAGEGA
jgi:hypothetical protein